MWFKASAPGSLMLLGEHAVLHGHAALVCAIDKRITVTLTPRKDRRIEILSALGNYQTDLSQLEIIAPFQFVLATLKKMQQYLKIGCNITIESEFSDKVGFSSSAAVTVAMLSTLSAWLNLAYSSRELISHAREIVQDVQTIGSGADIAACVLGGIVAYRMHPLFFESLPGTYPLTVVYSGNKMPTVETVSRVKNSFAQYSKLFSQLLQAIGECAEQGIIAVRNNNWGELGKIMNIQQGLMDALGVNTALLNAITEELRARPQILGAKISGSGLGDCVVGLGLAKDYVSGFSQQGAQPISVTMGLQGACYEKN